MVLDFRRLQAVEQLFQVAATIFQNLLPHLPDFTNNRIMAHVFWPSGVLRMSNGLSSQGKHWASICVLHQRTDRPARLSRTSAASVLEAGA
jgi:hypothetical protein